jgi:hypothetical protein
MGYRSEVIAMVPNSKAKEANEIIDYWDEEYSNETSTFFGIGHIKWYDVIDEVSKFEGFISKLHEKYEETGKDPACLIALGEDGACHTSIGDPYEHGIHCMSYLDCSEFEILRSKSINKKEINESNK